MSEACSLLIATEDIDVWCIAESDNRRITAAAKFTRDKKLAGVPSRRLVTNIGVVL